MSNVTMTNNNCKSGQLHRSTSVGQKDVAKVQELDVQKYTLGRFN